MVEYYKITIETDTIRNYLKLIPKKKKINLMFKTFKKSFKGQLIRLQVVLVDIILLISRHNTVNFI